MDYETFKTRKDAVNQIEKMSGWDAKPSQLFIPDNPNANKNGNVFVIQCKRGTGDPMYLRSDGYVR